MSNWAKVCIRCAVASTRRAISFLPKSSKGRSLGSDLRWFKTRSGSHVRSYFGQAGCKFPSPVQNLEMRRSSIKLGGIKSPTAALAHATVLALRLASISNCKNSKNWVTVGMKGWMLLDDVNCHQRAKAGEYVRRVEGWIEARAVPIAAGGVPWCLRADSKSERPEARLSRPKRYHQNARGLI